MRDIPVSPDRLQGRANFSVRVEMEHQGAKTKKIDGDIAARLAPQEGIKKLKEYYQHLSLITQNTV